MKKWIAAVCLLISMLACSKDTQDKLYGKWQLREVVEAGGTSHRVDTVWYNFQTSLFMYQMAVVSDTSTVYRQAYGFNTLEGADNLLLELVDPAPISAFLPYTDWPAARRSFTIDKVDRKELILSTDNKRYIFHKF